MDPGRRARAGPVGHRRPAGRGRARRRAHRLPGLDGRDAGAVRGRRARGGGASQAPPRRAQLRRPAQPAGRRPRGHHRRCAPADAAPVEVRPDRRVPGHRPGAVAGLPAGVRRVDHDGADRRPQAGDLRLPRRRHRHLPPGLGDRDHHPDPRGQLALRPPAAPVASTPCCRAPSSARSASSSTPSRRTSTSHGSAAPARRSGCGWCGAPSSARARGPSRRSPCGATTSSPTPPTTSSG